MMQEGRVRGRWDAWLDGGLDGSVASFALWTVAYQVALAMDASLRGVVLVWLPLSAVLVVLGARSQGRWMPTSPADAERQRERPTPRPLVVALVVTLVVAGALTTKAGILPAVALALLVLTDGLWRARRAGTSSPAAPTHSWLPLVVGAALALLASLLRRTDADDVFYMNRAAWVAEHGVPAVRDTMFGPETYPSTYGDGLLFPSVESLFGALAHVFGMRAGTLVYVGLVPVLAFLVALATWRLARTWAPRRVEGVFLVAVLAMVAGGESILGAYSVGRIWQGKVIAFTILMPLVWVYLTHTLHSDGRVVRRAQVMLLLAGIAFAGLTSGAPLIGPSVTAAAVLAAAVLGRRQLAVGGLLLAVGPVLAGLSVVLRGGGAGEGDMAPLTSEKTLAVVLGSNAVLVVIGLLAMTVGARALRPEGVVLASCAGVASLVAVLPGVSELVDAVTGAGPIAWRLATVAPLAVLLGVLLVVAVPDGLPVGAGRWPVGLVAVVGAATLVVAGTPLWGGGSALGEPGWKVDPTAYDDVGAILDLPSQSGTLLLPEDQSAVLAVMTASRFATIPRPAYLSSLDDTEERNSARHVLFSWLNEHSPLISRGVTDRLDLLDVAVVCVPDDARLEEQLTRVAAAADTKVTETGSLTCAARSGPSWSGP